LKISVIIPVYNVERYLARCLDSVLASVTQLSTLNSQPSVEIICVNDGSTDGSAKILEHYNSTFNLQSSTSKRRLIILANQMTPDDTPEVGQKVKKVYECWLDEMADVVASHPEVSVVLRNHPRFYNIVDLSDWKVKYPWLGVDQRPFDQVFPESICCVTINSTTVFDAIPYGCPSVLIDGSEAGWKNIMVDEYSYPYGKLTVQKLLEMKPNDLVEMRERLQKWYNTYYTPFDAERALKLIKGEL